MSFNFAYGPDVFQGLDMDAFLRRMQSSALPERSEAEMKAQQMLAGGGTTAGGGTIPPIMAPPPEVISGIIPDPNAGSASGVIPDRNPDGSPMVGYPEMYDRPPAIVIPGILEPVNPPTGNELIIGTRPPMQGDPGYDPTPGPGYVQPSLFSDMNIDDYLAGIVSLQPGVIGSNRDDDLLLKMRQSSPLPERSEAEMKAQQMTPQGGPYGIGTTNYVAQEDPAPTSSGSEGISSLRQMVFERYQPLVSQQRSYKSYIG